MTFDLAILKQTINRTLTRYIINCRLYIQNDQTEHGYKGKPKKENNYFPLFVDIVEL